MTEYEKLLSGAKRLTEMGGLPEALELLQKMKQAYPEHIHEIGLEECKVMFQQERYEEALDAAIALLPQDDGTVFRWIMETYYDPYEEEAQQMRQHNMQCLEQYEYFYGTEDKHDIKALLYDGCKKLIFYGTRTIGRYVGIPEITLPDNEIALIINIFNIDNLAEEISRTKYHGPMPDYEIPVYLYYDEENFYALVQCVDLEPLLKDKRVVLLVGEEQLRHFLGEGQVRIPQKYIGFGHERINEIVNEQLRIKEGTMQCDKVQLKEYYSTSKEDINKRIREQKPRILFLTSFHTTVIKYHTRDLNCVAEKAGLDTEILMERGSIFSKYEYDYYKTINSFRPDIIFCIDHFRFEVFDIPQEIVWICWVQDALDHIMDKNTPKKMGMRDFLLNHFTTWREFREVGYPSERVIDAPVPSNQDIYKPYKLTSAEEDLYGCDICFVCHASDVDVHIKEIVSLIPEELQDKIYAVYKGYQQYVYQTGELFYQKEVFREYIKGALLQHFDIVLKDRWLEYLADDMYLWFNQRVFREALVDWILDAGFTNVKLWGNGWQTNQKYKPYAMGPAQNGETLSKIYQASKIVMGNNVTVTAVARAWETMLSGGFYLSNYVPKEEDLSDIRKILEVDKDFIMFYNKTDLIEKLRYYLEHGDERNVMKEKGRKAALEKMTFDSLLKKMLSEVAARL